MNTSNNIETVTIKRNDFDEFEVPTPTPDYPFSIYFTDDKQDAVDTARAHYFLQLGENEINVRIIRGHYNH